MSERLFGLVDCGGTNNRAVVVDSQMRIRGANNCNTDPEDYDGTVQGFADRIEHLAVGQGELVVVSIAIAAEVSEEDGGRLLKAGGLTSWKGRCIRTDVAAAFDLPLERVAADGDMKMAVLSQQHINKQNRRPVNGVGMSLGSGWGGAKYSRDGTTESDEPGHHYLRAGGTCPCGEEGHAEAFISGNGAKKNHDMPMEERLRDLNASDQFVADVSTSVIQMVERHREEDFHAEELRWTGSVALKQPFLMQRASEQVRYYFGVTAPAWDLMSRGDQAGLHGTFLAAQRLAAAA